MELTPKQIVAELDRYIIGQNEAKKSVAVALRNRYRRAQLSPEVREEITPKNIIMKGPTGVGKTEIARRLAKLVKAPFIKVEATKYTEVGYVGRDVESMIRDLVECAIRLVKEEKFATVQPRAQEAALKKLTDALLPIRKKENPDTPEQILREELTADLRKGALDKLTVTLSIEEAPKQLQLGPIGSGGNENNLGEFFGRMMPRQKKERKMTVGEAFVFLTQQEADRLIDNDSINAEGLKRAEQEGIVFIDEIDKIAGTNGKSGGPDVSREGVQRDILPIVEGCSINTKYGILKTDFILFIAAGAFHISKVSDLIPELQGRFPVVVELQSLTEDDFVKILKEPDNAIIMQYAAMLKVDKVDLRFTDDAIREIARIAYWENENNENIGARRLQSVMELLLEEINFTAGEQTEEIELVIDKDYVGKHLDSEMRRKNLTKYIL